MGKYFTEQERYKLEGMLQAGMHKKEIAQALNKSLKTIYNEIKRVYWSSFFVTHCSKKYLAIPRFHWC